MMSKKSYITDYLLNLSERSRTLKKGDYKIGFDWIIYRYGLSNDWQPIKIPFARETADAVVTHKTEAEFGIDLSFYDSKNEQVIAFVLKAEKLTYANWTSKKFHDDLQRASNPNFVSTEIPIEQIKRYKIITVYNKHDDANGIGSYDNFVNSANKTICDNIGVEFERWNIDKFAEIVAQNMLSAEVLPSNLSGLLAYITSQFRDFCYGTTEWESQLIPNWKNFLNIVFEKGVDESRINLIPFALTILKNNSPDRPSAIVGWIDLTEWAMLKLWDVFPNLTQEQQKIVINVWFDFYLGELHQYFGENREILTMTWGINVGSWSASLIPINTINSTYWHLARLCIYGLSATDISNNEAKQEWYQNSYIYLDKFIESNPSALCPLIDLHHIEIAMVFLLYKVNGQLDKLKLYFNEMLNYLTIRRKSPESSLPFIECANRMDLIAERVIMKTKPVDWTEKSSYFLLVLIELCFSFNAETRDALVDNIFNDVVKGEPEVNEEIDLVGWLPPKDWADKIFKGMVRTGTGISTPNFNHPNKNSTKYDLISDFVKNTSKHDIKITELTRPLASHFLACIKNQSPLPPEFWRFAIFDDLQKQPEQQ